MTTQTIREIINEAILGEERTGQLRTYLHDRQTQLAQKLILPEHRPVAALMLFITGYIESVPSSLSLVAAVSKKLGFHTYAAPFLLLAEGYFLQPPEPIAHAPGLLGLLDEAFLAHRLLEEVNDNHMRHLNRQLLPVDMTEANTIVHHLIGDTLATQLEHLVQYAASQLLAEEKAWEQVKHLPASAVLPETIVSSEQLMWEPHKVRLRMAS